MLPVDGGAVISWCVRRRHPTRLPLPALERVPVIDLPVRFGSGAPLCAPDVSLGFASANWAQADEEIKQLVAALFDEVQI